MNREQQKEIAIECLETLDIYKPYIRKFKSKAGTPCFFEHYAGFYVDQEPEIYHKMQELEREHNILVYALTHEITNLGETWSMLCVPSDTESIEKIVQEDLIRMNTMSLLMSGIRVMTCSLSSEIQQLNPSAADLREYINKIYLQTTFLVI